MKAAELGHARGFLLGLVALTFLACDSSPTRKPDGGGPNDGGGGSSSLDASKNDDGGFIRRRDAATTSVNDPVPMCDRFEPSPCGAGQECRLVISRSMGADAAVGFLIYAGCVEGVDSREAGAPCTPFGGQSHQYTAPGLTDEVYVDPCAPGLYCAADPKIRDHYSCQHSCEPPTTQGGGVACPATQSCNRTNPNDTILQWICLDGDHCDPSDPTSCGPGLACFLRPNDLGTSVLSQCLPVSDMPVADGTACSYLNGCNRGSSCWGPTRLTPDQWQDKDVVCRRDCQVGAPTVIDTPDGGTDDADAGVAVGCSASQICVPLSDSKADVSSVVPAPGLCE